MIKDFFKLLYTYNTFVKPYLAIQPLRAVLIDIIIMNGNISR